MKDLTDEQLAVLRRQHNLGFCVQQLEEMQTGTQSNPENTPERLLAVGMRQWDYSKEIVTEHLRSIGREDLVPILEKVEPYEPEPIPMVKLGVCPVCGDRWQVDKLDESAGEDASNYILESHPPRGGICLGTAEHPTRIFEIEEL